MRGPRYSTYILLSRYFLLSNVMQTEKNMMDEQTVSISCLPLKGIPQQHIQRSTFSNLQSSPFQQGITQEGPRGARWEGWLKTGSGIRDIFLERYRFESGTISWLSELFQPVHLKDTTNQIRFESPAWRRTELQAETWRASDYSHKKYRMCLKNAWIGSSDL